jgi:DNA polymerase-3 subunit epsilon
MRGAFARSGNGGAAGRDAGIEEADFVVFDTELTGLDFKRDSIISIGAVRMKGRRILPGHIFYRLVKPLSELKSQNVVVHGLTHSDLEGAEPAAKVLEAFMAFVGDAILVCHFAFIDLHFLNRVWKGLTGEATTSPVLDTSSVHDWLCARDRGFAARYCSGGGQRDLFAVAETHGIAVERAHNALYDAYITAQLLQRLYPALRKAGIDQVEEVLSTSRT